MIRYCKIFLLPILIILVLIGLPAIAQDKKTDPPYTDVAHFSKVFGREKFFRLYLPKGYSQSKEHYPVIYFFHGWGGRHFKDDNANLEYEMIKELVDKYNVILVMWDGNMEESEPRPYNIGNHEDVKYTVQMKDYFPELVHHIDSTYRTITDRMHRGIIGFSMGGIMSYYLAGKYPDKVCAAVYLTGSPEFFIGYPENHTLYSVRYTFKNLEGVKLRMHNSTHDELVYLNEEVDKGAKWEGGLFYDYWQFNGGHVVDLPGKTDVFERAMKFVVEAFKNPLPQPERWWHYDLYPEFDVWGYHVKSNKEEPGFIYLKNVSKSGFGIHSRKWLPDGPPLSSVMFEVTTPPIYQPETKYNLIQFINANKSISVRNLISDKEGRLNIKLFNENEVGIYKTGDVPDLVFADYKMKENRRYLRSGEENKITLEFFNRGGEVIKSQKIEVELTTKDSLVSIENKNISATLGVNKRTALTPEFTITAAKQPPSHGEPAWIKFNLKMQIGEHTSRDEFTLPVFFDVPKLDSIRVDDGVLVKDKVYGRGNGDGKVSAGESIMIYAGNHRLRLYTDDPYVEIDNEQIVDEVLPAKWPDGYTLSSVIKVSAHCPKDHVIEFLASYDTRIFMSLERKVTWGKVFIKVEP